MSSPERTPISAVIIAQDAGKRLTDCLAALSFCDEIVLVDSGSTDGTIELAERAGARVISSHWRGYGSQKQFAVAMATHDWVLCVDADECVSDELRASISAVWPAPTPPRYSAYQFPRCNKFMGRYLKHGEGYPDWSLRLFDRRHAQWSDDPVHEKVITQAEVGTLIGDLLHDSAETLDSYLAKQNRYTTLAAQEALVAGKRTGLAQLLLSPAIRFIKFYFIRRGFLDGLPGLVHILIGCQNSFTKYAKMIHAQQQSQESHGDH